MNFHLFAKKAVYFQVENLIKHLTSPLNHCQSDGVAGLSLGSPELLRHSREAD